MARSLQAAIRWGQGDERHVHPTQRSRLTTRQGVHRLLRHRKSNRGLVHSQDVDRGGSVRDGIACATLRGVITRHGIHPTNVWIGGERAQRGVAGVFGLKTVDPIGTRYVIEGEAGVVIVGVVGKRRRCLREDTKTGDEAEDGNEKGGKVVHR